MASDASGPRDQPLIESFLVVGLAVAGPSGPPTPVVKYHYSASSGASHDALLKTCVNFCFPVIDESGRTPWPASESFTYTLTEDDGTRLFGFCRRLKQPQSAMPDAICILTKRQWSSFFAHMLDILQLRFDLDAFVPPFIEAVARAPPPRPGGACVLSPWGERGESFVLNAPDESAPPVASFELLFSALGTLNVLRLVAALLHESRVVIIARQLGDISTVAHSVLALLQPFTWQHVFIPVLPTAMIDYVAAPMPFVVGVLEAHRGLLLQQPMDHCVFVEVDRSKIRGDDSVPQLPRPHRDTLFRRLETLKAPRDGRARYDPRLVTDAFLAFFAAALHDYREYENPTAVRAARERLSSAEAEGRRRPHLALDELFDHAAFVGAQPRELQPFLASLRGVQMWEAWLTESVLLADTERAARPFERRLADAASRLATMPAPLDGKPRVSGKERAREAVMGLRFAMALGAPALGRPQSAQGGTPPGRGGGGGQGQRSEQVAAAVEQARAAGAQHLHAAQARARSVASQLRERSVHFGLRRPASDSQLSDGLDAAELHRMMAGVVLHSSDGGLLRPAHDAGQVGMQPVEPPPEQRRAPSPEAAPRGAADGGGALGCDPLGALDGAAQRWAQSPPADHHLGALGQPVEGAAAAEAAGQPSVAGGAAAALSGGGDGGWGCCGGGAGDFAAQLAARPSECALIDVGPPSDHDALASLFSPGGSAVGARAHLPPVEGWPPLTHAVESRASSGDLADFGLLAEAGDASAVASQGAFF